jgi:hypothetical protein
VVESSVRPGETSVNVHGDDISIEPGQHVVHAHIRTRLALWYLMIRRFGDLRATCNWAVALTSEGG